MVDNLGIPRVCRRDTFKRPGLRFETYSGMGHSSSEQELDHLKSWLLEALK